MNRVVISAAITHIRNAKDAIESLPQDHMDQQTMTELSHVRHILDDSIKHCQSLFGPASTQDQ